MSHDCRFCRVVDRAPATVSHPGDAGLVGKPVLHVPLMGGRMRGAG